jgi:hypothetical protein
MALLYIGPHCDVFPLTCPELTKQFSEFIYVDREPRTRGCARHPYWYDQYLEPQKAVLRNMCDFGGQFINLKLKDFALQTDGGWSAMIGSTRFTYYMNGDNMNVSKVPTEVLSRVTTLYIHGYNPPVSVLDSLPNVTLLYSTFDCALSSKIFRRQSQISTLSEWRYRTHIDEAYFCNNCNSFIRHSCGKLRFESIADVVYCDEHGDDSDQDSDDNSDEDCDE